MQRKRLGFTLIELLVVIAIIAILAAIIFPVFSSAKARAQDTACMNNMLQISKAFNMYCDDNAGHLPQPYNMEAGNMNTWDVRTWRQRISSYLKSKRALLCGVKTHDISFAAAPPIGKGFYVDQLAARYSHYGMNTYISMNDAMNAYPTITRIISTIDQPTKTILVCENIDGDWSGEPYDNGTTGYNGQFYGYHGGGSNSEQGGMFTFCDGHAAFMSVSKTERTINGIQYYFWKVHKSINP